MLPKQQRAPEPLFGVQDHPVRGLDCCRLAAPFDSPWQTGIKPASATGQRARGVPVSEYAYEPLR